MNKLSFFSAALLLTFTAGAVSAQEPADTLKDVRPFGTHALELIREAGVEVISSPGAPGMVPTIYVRGLGVIPGILPVYIVDGIRKKNLDGIAPESIETIEVLKDASVMGIYGPEASAGVVVVKTRRALQKGFHAGYTFSGGFQSLANEPEKMSFSEWQRYGFFTDEPYVVLETPTPETSFLQNHAVHAQYSGNKWNAYAGLSVLDNNGPYSGRGDAHRRYAASWSAEYQPLKWLSLETTGRWTHSKANMAPSGWLNDYLVARPQYARANRRPSQYSKWDNFTETDIQGKVTIRPFRGLCLRGFAGITHGGRELYQSEWIGFLDPASNEDYVKFEYNRTNGEWYQAGVDASWSGQWKGHRIQLGAGFRWQKNDQVVCAMTEGRVTLSRFGLNYGDDKALIENVLNPYFNRKRPTSAEELLDELIAGNYPSFKTARLNSPERAMWKENTVSLSYDWKNRYRVDASYFYVWADKPFSEGVFHVPAVTLTWNPSEEPLLRRLLPAWWTGWSVKASWAQSDEYISLMNPDIWLDVFRRPDAYTTSRHRDLSTSMKFRSGKTTLDLSAAWYIYDDDYIGDTGSYTLATGPIKESLYTIHNSGVELSAGLRNASGAIRYSVNSWVSFYRNQVTAVAHGHGWLYQWRPNLIVYEGEPIGSCLVATMKDGVAAYKEEKINKGNFFPTLTGGFSVAVGWKNWQMTVSGHGDKGHTIGHVNTYDALIRHYLKMYRTDANPDGQYVFDNLSAISGTELYANPGDFFRIDQIRLDYTLPIRRASLNLFASLENWFLFTKYPGSDPELSMIWNSIGVETASYPSTRRTIFGLSLSF